MIPNKNIDKIYDYLLLLFCFTIPFTHQAKAVPNIILILLIMLYPFHSSKKLIKSIKKELLAIAIFIIIIAANTILFDRSEDFKELVRLAYIPLILILFSPAKEIKTYLNSFLFSAFLLLLLSSIQLGLKFVREGNIDISEGEQVTQLLLGERPYLGFLYFIAACFSFYFYISVIKKWLRIAYFILGILFIFFILIIVARIMLLAIIISSILSFFYFYKEIKLIVKSIGIVFLFLIGLLYVFSNNIAKRFYIEEEYVNVITADPRYHIWDCVYRILPDNPKEFLFGKGYVKTNNELLECYHQKNDFFNELQKKWFIKSGFNTHNQFFDLLLSYGIIVLGLCLFFFIYAVIKNKKKFFVICLLLATFLFFSVENVLKRQIGCMLIAFMLCFVFKEKNAISNSSSIDNPVT